MMKKIFLIFVFAGISFLSAQSKEEIEPTNIKAPQKLLLQATYSGNSEISMKEKFLSLNYQDKSAIPAGNNDNRKSEDEKAENEINYAKTQSEGFKLGTEVYYFLGAAAVAAIIYFLVPDDNPPAEKNYTFGLPVTPK